MKTDIRIEKFRVPPGENVKLKECPTLVEPFYKSKKRYHKLLEEYVDELSSLQRMHYASDRYAVLLIFQGMDAAGKDGAIRHVMSGVNPQGCQVFSFKQPNSEELEHDFLCARRDICRSEGGSASSIVPTMRKCSSFVCIQRFSTAKGFRMSCRTRRRSG